VTGDRKNKIGLDSPLEFLEALDLVSGFSAFAVPCDLSPDS
jgi:hypothetical protein